MDGLRRSRVWILCLGGLLAACGSSSQNLQSAVIKRAQLQITPFPNFDFGSVQIKTSVSQVFRITNAGTLPASNMSSDFYMNINFQFEGGTFPGTNGNCGSSLAVGESCDVSVVFTPQYVSGFSQPLQIHYTDSGQSWVTDTPIMTGTGI